MFSSIGGFCRNLVKYRQATDRLQLMTKKLTSDESVYPSPPPPSEVFPSLPPPELSNQSCEEVSSSSRLPTDELKCPKPFNETLKKAIAQLHSNRNRYVKTCLQNLAKVYKLHYIEIEDEPHQCSYSGLFVGNLILIGTKVTSHMFTGPKKRTTMEAIQTITRNYTNEHIECGISLLCGILKSAHEILGFPCLRYHIERRLGVYWIIEQPSLIRKSEQNINSIAHVRPLLPPETRIEISGERRKDLKLDEIDSSIFPPIPVPVIVYNPERRAAVCLVNTMTAAKSRPSSTDKEMPVVSNTIVNTSKGKVDWSQPLCLLLKKIAYQLAVYKNELNEGFSGNQQISPPNELCLFQILMLVLHNEAN